MVDSMREREYVLGTHDEEIARLKLQHATWRPIVLDAWRFAGLGPGMAALDVGCGPGFATMDLAEQVAPGGHVFAIDQSARFLEHLERRTWQMLPPCDALTRFVSEIMAAWRESGGEPDVGRMLPAWLTAAGFTLKRVRPYLFAASPGEPMWAWPSAFVASGMERLVTLGRMTQQECDDMRAEIAAASHAGHLMVTPAVLELVATLQ